MSCDIQREGCTVHSRYIVSVTALDGSDYQAWDACPECAAWFTKQVKEESWVPSGS